MEVDVLQDFAALCRRAPALVELAASTSVFLSVPWMETLYHHGLPKADALRIYVAGRAGEREPDVALPMRAQRPGGLLGARRLRSLSNFYTPLYAPLTGPARRADQLERLVGRIAAERPAWDAVLLEPMDPGAESFGILRQALSKAGFAPVPHLRFGNWYLPTAGVSYTEYEARLPGRVRSTLRRKSRALERAGTVRFRLITADGDGMEAAIRDYEALYAASWKTPEPYAGFIPNLARMAAARGWLRLGFLDLDGAPVATQLWLVHAGVASIYKLAYQPALARHSPGTLLTSWMLRHALDVDGVQEVDYLTGDDPYKKDWMSHRRERWGLLALNRRTLRGRGLLAVEQLRSAAARARSVLRRTHREAQND